MAHDDLDANARLALDTCHRQVTEGIPTCWLNIMSHPHLERLAGTPRGSYREQPEAVYLAAQRAAGACLLDQYIPGNPLSMDEHGWLRPPSATTGAAEVVVDGRPIREPEDVVAHLVEVAFPQLRQATAEFDEEARYRAILAGEESGQALLRPWALKTGHAFVRFPGLPYTTYGYVPYLSAYAGYPEVMAEHFALQADLALRNNRAAARAYREGGLPPVYRLDYDLADSRGTLVGIESLERLWLPHFARCLEPLVAAGVRLLWHCDGNLTHLLPRLLEAGLAGFQGFQYEAGMDYQAIARMRTRDGEPVMLMAGVSVSATLPFGTPAEVRDELRWLVRHGPPTGLFLGVSSSICPGVPWPNMQALLDGLAWFRERGRAGL